MPIATPEPPSAPRFWTLRAIATVDFAAYVDLMEDLHPGRRLAALFLPGTHDLEGLAQLQGLDNLYFDTSANCDPIAHQAIMRLIGPDKLMYGSDLPASPERGRSGGVGNTFLWLYEDTDVWKEKHLTIEPILVGLKHLRSVKRACWCERLTDREVQDIFWNNAASIFEV